MKIHKMNMKRAMAVLGGSFLAMLSSGCGMEGFGTAKMNFASEKVFACPAGNDSPGCAGVAHGSLLVPGSTTGSILATGNGDGASGSLPASGGSGASGSVPASGTGGASGSLPTGGGPAGSSIPSGDMSCLQSTNGAGGSLPTGGSTAGSSLPTGGSSAGGSLPTGGSSAGGSLPTGGSSAGGSLPTGGSSAGSGFPAGGSGSSAKDLSVSSAPPFSMAGSQLTINPTKVCSPNVSTASQSFLKTMRGGVKAVLYTFNRSLDASIVQVWDSTSDQSQLVSKLKQFSPFILNLNQPLAPGKYSLVMYDAQREFAPYNYDWAEGQTAIAPMNDAVAHQIVPHNTFTVNSDGSIGGHRIYPVLYSTFDDPECEGAERIDPLVIRVGDIDDSLQMSSIHQGVCFDILGDRGAHVPKRTSWIQNPNYMFLVLPKNGQVNGIDQMFGNGSHGPDGELAAHGFEALAKFDLNHDGVIDAKDDVFSHLRLWSDKNRDGVSQAGELFTLENMGIVSLTLSYDPSFSEVDQFGNAAKFKSTAATADGGAYLLFDLWMQLKN